MNNGKILPIRKGFITNVENLDYYYHFSLFLSHFVALHRMGRRLELFNGSLSEDKNVQTLTYEDYVPIGEEITDWIRTVLFLQSFEEFSDIGFLYGDISNYNGNLFPEYENARSMYILEPYKRYFVDLVTVPPEVENLNDSSDFLMGNFPFGEFQTVTVRNEIGIVRLPVIFNDCGDVYINFYNNNDNCIFAFDYLSIPIHVRKRTFFEHLRKNSMW